LIFKKIKGFVFGEKPLFETLLETPFVEMF
jgi:hypothetical protein